MNQQETRAIPHAIATVAFSLVVACLVRFAAKNEWLSSTWECGLNLSLFVLLCLFTWRELRWQPQHQMFRMVALLYFTLGTAQFALDVLNYGHFLGEIGGQISNQIRFVMLAGLWACPFVLIYAHIYEHGRTKRELDQQVATRTQELTAANVQLQREICQRMDIANELHQAKRDLEELIVERTKKAEDAERALIRHERLLAVGQMASGIAHELNNTLTPIVSYSNLLCMKAELPTKQEKWLEHIDHAASEAVRVVKTLQQFSREAVDEDFLPIDLRPMILQVKELTRPIWNDASRSKGYRVAFETDLQDAPHVSVKPAEMRQVLTNLVLNAAEALEGDGTVSVNLRHDEAQDRVTVQIIDTGKGMSLNDMKCCFDPFYTTKQEGTGLGLSVCHGIVQNHNGSLDVRSQLDHGTVFELSLPIAPDVVAEPTTTCPSAKCTDAIEMLFVEDHDGVRVSISCLLENVGIQVTAVKSGAEALDELKRRTFDIIFTDLGLPVMDGSELTQHIRGDGSTTPIVVMSGWPRKKINTYFEGKTRPNAIVSKPAQLNDIVDVIHRLTA